MCPVSRQPSAAWVELHPLAKPCCCPRKESLPYRWVWSRRRRQICCGLCRSCRCPYLWVHDVALPPSPLLPDEMVSEDNALQKPLGGSRQCGVTRLPRSLSRHPCAHLSGWSSLSQMNGAGLLILHIFIVHGFCKRLHRDEQWLQVTQIENFKSVSRMSRCLQSYRLWRLWGRFCDSDFLTFNRHLYSWGVTLVPFPPHLCHYHHLHRRLHRHHHQHTFSLSEVKHPAAFVLEWTSDHTGPTWIIENTLRPIANPLTSAPKSIWP